MNWFWQGFQKYADFSGRARRAEYWSFVLIFDLMMGVLLFFAYLFTEDYLPNIVFLGLAGLLALVCILPLLAVQVRRLHDTGKPGWFILIGLVPYIGSLILLVLMCLDSQPGFNQYGENPKELEAINAVYF